MSANRKPRKKVLPDGQGNYRLYKMQGENLVPVDKTGYDTTMQAMKGLRKQASNLNGQQVLILRAVEIVSVTVETNPRVKLTRGT